jgi:hypothetical protein
MTPPEMKKPPPAAPVVERAASPKGVVDQLVEATEQMKLDSEASLKMQQTLESLQRQMSDLAL